MNNSMNDLKNTYRTMIKPRKTLDEIVNYLQSNVDIKPMELQSLYASPLGVCCTAYEHNLQMQGYPTENLKWVAYEVLNTKNNKDYYKSSNFESLYVVFEKTTGWIYSNSQLLFLELTVERGISQYDYEHETNDLKCLFMYIEGYLRNCEFVGRNICL